MIIAGFIHQNTNKRILCLTVYFFTDTSFKINRCFAIYHLHGSVTAVTFLSGVKGTCVQWYDRWEGRGSGRWESISSCWETAVHHSPLLTTSSIRSCQAVSHSTRPLNRQKNHSETGLISLLITGDCAAADRVPVFWGFKETQQN